MDAPENWGSRSVVSERAGWGPARWRAASGLGGFGKVGPTWKEIPALGDGFSNVPAALMPGGDTLLYRPGPSSALP